MKNQRNYSFFIGVILFLIYEKCFFVLFSLNEISLFQFKGTETLYIIGLILTIILTNTVIISLYRSFIRLKTHNKAYTVRLITILLLGIIFYLGANYYLGYLGSNGIEQDIQNVFLKYYGYKNTIYFINTTILIVVYGFYILRYNSSNNQRGVS